MTNCIFYSSFFVLFLNISFGSLKYSQIHRAFMSIYKGTLEASSITVDENGEPVLPYYDQDSINDYIYSYLNANISKFTKNYEVNIYYYKRDFTEYCVSHCSNISINLKAKINIFYSYDNTLSFYVSSREEL